MNTMLRCFLLLGVVLAGGRTTHAQDDLSKVEKEIVQAWQEHKSLSAKITMDKLLEVPDGKYTTKAEGTYRFLRKDDKFLFRVDVQNTIEGQEGGKTWKQDTTLTIIGDRTGQFILVERAGKKSAVKQKYDPLNAVDMEQIFDALRQRYALRLMPEDPTERTSTYLIEGAVKQRKPDDLFDWLKIYVGKKDGVVRKQVMKGLGGKRVQTLTFSDLKFDLPLDPQLFEFKLPEGVTLEDKTGE